MLVAFARGPMILELTVHLSCWLFCDYSVAFPLVPTLIQVHSLFLQLLPLCLLPACFSSTDRNLLLLPGHRLGHILHSSSSPTVARRGPGKLVSRGSDLNPLFSTEESLPPPFGMKAKHVTMYTKPLGVHPLKINPGYHWWCSMVNLTC